MRTVSERREVATHWYCAALTALGLAWPSLAFSQAATPPREVTGRPHCASCRVEVRHILTLGSVTDSILVRERFAAVARTPGGAYLVSGENGGIIEFDSRGAYRRSIGRSGQGPGEFGRFITGLLPRSQDTTYVVADSRTMLVVDRNGTEARRTALDGIPALLGAHASEAGVVAFAGARTVRDTIRQLDLSEVAITTLAPDGRHLASWTVRSTAADNRCTRCERIGVAWALASEELWVIHPDRYALERWNNRGRLLDSFRIVGADWFERWRREMAEAPVTASSRGQGRGNAAPIQWAPVLSVAQRSDGLLVVAGGGPIESFRATLDQVQRSLAGQNIRSVMRIHVEEEKTGITFLDVVDPALGVVASARMDRRDLRLLNGQYAYRYVEHPTGIVQIEIWEIALVR